MSLQTTLKSIESVSEFPAEELETISRLSLGLRRRAPPVRAKRETPGSFRLVPFMLLGNRSTSWVFCNLRRIGVGRVQGSIFGGGWRRVLRDDFDQAGVRHWPLCLWSHLL